MLFEGLKATSCKLHPTHTSKRIDARNLADPSGLRQLVECCLNRG
jgi:hypothetical protein